MTINQLLQLSIKDLSSIFGTHSKRFYQDFGDFKRAFSLRKNSEGKAIEFRVELSDHFYGPKRGFTFSIDPKGRLLLPKHQIYAHEVAFFFFLECLGKDPLSAGGCIEEVVRGLFPTKAKPQNTLGLDSVVLLDAEIDLVGNTAQKSHGVIERKGNIELPYYESGISYEINRKLNRNHCLDNIYLTFSNGHSMALPDFLTHPYSILLPDLRIAILAWISDAGTPSRLRSLAWSTSRDSFWVNESENNLFFSIVHRFLDSHKVFLGALTEEELPEQLISLSNTRLKQVLPLEDYKEGQIGLDETLDHGRIWVRLLGRKHPEGFEALGINLYDASTCTLHVPPVKSSFSRVSKALGRNFEVHSSIDQDDGSKCILVEGHPPPEEIVKILKKTNIQYKASTIPKENLKINVHVQLDPDDSGFVEICPRINVSGVTYQVRPRSDKFRRVLIAFRLGIAGFFDKEAKLLAVRSPEFRSNELKLYKHCGFVRFLALEAVHLLQNSKSIPLTPSAIRSHVKVLESKTATFLHFLFTKEKGVELASMDEIGGVFVSKKCTTQVRKFISSIFQAFQEEECFIGKGRVHKIPTGNFHLQIFQFFSTTLAGDYTSKELLRGKSDDFGMGLYHGTSVFSKIDSKPEAIFDFHFKERIRFQQAADIGTLRIGDKTIESLSAEDLAARASVVGGSERDWFELHPKYFFRGKEISAQKAVQFSQGEVVEFQGNFYRVDPKAVPSMKSLERFWSRISDTRRWGTKVSGTQVDFQMERSKVLDLLALKHQGVEVSGDEAWDQIANTYENLEEAQRIISKSIDVKLKDFGTKLRDFQLEGVRWMMSLNELGLGCLLADDMGLGKTVQSVALLHCSQKAPHPHLIVVPTSLVHNWSSEIQRFSSNLTVVSFEGGSKALYESEWEDDAPDVCLVTYGLLVQHEEFFLKRTWSICIFDEAQNLKNVKAQRRKAATGIDATHKVALTGTPLENHYGELYSLIDICVPGALGPYSDFMTTFGGILKGADQNNAAEDLEFLKKKIRPLILRRTKALVLEDLPEKNETVVALPFDKKQAEVYKKMALAWNQQISGLVSLRGESGAQLEMLTALLKLRQICSLPASVEGVGPGVTSPKFELLKEKLLELDSRGESAIVFTNFLSTLEELKRILGIAGLKTLSICGKDSKKKRQAVLNQFNTAERPHHLVMTLKSGGVGLNLTRANYVFHFEPWWNPAAENQGTDRVHRIGQNKGVQVYRYIMKDSVEEKIQDLKLNKKRAFDLLFEDDPDKLKSSLSLKASSLSQADFEALLS